MQITKKKMYMFSKLKNKVSGFVLIFRKKNTQKQSLLYDSIEDLLVKPFFKIMETGNLNLLKKKNVRVSAKKLEETWENLKEQYWKEKDKQKYKAFLKKQKRIRLLEIEISACKMCIAYYEMTGQIHESFKDFGYEVRDGKDVEKVRQHIGVKMTKFSRILIENEILNEAESTSFWEILTDFEAMLNEWGVIKGQLDIENTTVSRWIAYEKTLKKRQMAQKK